ncbi:MAG TPA: hypothetical protein VIY86_07875, partial [Pirellulaceae bacterium]
MTPVGRWGAILGTTWALVAAVTLAIGEEPIPRARIVDVTPVTAELGLPRGWSHPPSHVQPATFPQASEDPQVWQAWTPETTTAAASGTAAGPGCEPGAFCPDPNYGGLPYDSGAAQWVYDGKQCVPSQRPWVELGRGLYRFGELPPASPVPFGCRNLTIPHFLVYGDYRTALATIDNGPGPENAVWA